MNYLLILGKSYLKLMPSTDDPMIRIEFHVPQPLLDEAKEMAGDDKIRMSEFHRRLWSLGLVQYAEQASQRMNRRELKQRLKRGDGTEDRL